MALQDVPLTREVVARLAGATASSVERDRPDPAPSSVSYVDARRLADLAEAAREGLGDAGRVAGLLPGPELAGLTRDLLAVMQIAEASVVALVTEAIDRGLIHCSTAAGPAQWVTRLSQGEPLRQLLPCPTGGTGVGPTGRAGGAGGAGGSGSGPLVGYDERAHEEPTRCEATGDVDDWLMIERALPGVEPVVASRIAKVAAACLLPRNQVVTEALAAHQVGVPAARTALEEVDRTALEEVDRVLHVLPGMPRDEAFGYFLALPPGSGSKAIRELTRRLVARFGDPDQTVQGEDRMDAAERLTWASLPNGLTRVEADLSPTHATILRHAIDALSAPAPGSTCCDDPFHRHTGDPTGEQDQRPAAKRRVDALMLLAQTAAGLLDDDAAVMTSGPVTLVVTIDADTLAGRIADTVPGFAATAAGEAISAADVRRMACDARIIPMVLGSDSQPLDVGRAHRLVTGGLRAAVIHRDTHCTFPGCARPPGWCQIHHVIPWQHGGATSLTNSALLCARHHTIVHRHQLTATVTNTNVTWDLHPGRMTSRSNPSVGRDRSGVSVLGSSVVPSADAR